MSFIFSSFIILIRKKMFVNCRIVLFKTLATFLFILSLLFSERNITKWPRWLFQLSRLQKRISLQNYKKGLLYVCRHNAYTCFDKDTFLPLKTYCKVCNEPRLIVMDQNSSELYENLATLFTILKLMNESIPIHVL